MNEYSALGVMSGSSLDGLDLALALFRKDGDQWSFRLTGAETIPFPEPLSVKLRGAHLLSGEDLAYLDLEFGKWIAEKISFFLGDGPAPLLIGLHGHTTFHEPARQLSIQIGNGEVIASQSGIPVVDAFRSKDVILGGQGAPLVPAGEQFLFPGYDAFVNLGGIANLSVRKDRRVVAWDVTPCNQLLNHLAGKEGLPYDDDGALARKGKTVGDWVSRMEALPYFHQSPPKSMSNQWVRDHFLSDFPEATPDALRSCCELISNQLSKALLEHLPPQGKVLVTGGGTHNRFLVELLQAKSKGIFLTIPDSALINYKEALIFGFLGVLRYLTIENTFASVTGAKKNSVSGVLHLP